MYNKKDRSWLLRSILYPALLDLFIMLVLVLSAYSEIQELAADGAILLAFFLSGTVFFRVKGTPEKPLLFNLSVLISHIVMCLIIAVALHGLAFTPQWSLSTAYKKWTGIASLGFWILILLPDSITYLVKKHGAKYTHERQSYDMGDCNRKRDYSWLVKSMAFIFTVNLLAYMPGSLYYYHKISDLAVCVLLFVIFVLSAFGFAIIKRRTAKPLLFNLIAFVTQIVLTVIDYIIFDAMSLGWDGIAFLLTFMIFNVCIYCILLVDTVLCLFKKRGEKVTAHTEQL